MRFAFFEGGLEASEGGEALRVEHDDLAVEDRGVGRDALHGSGDGLDAVGPVEAGAGEYLDGVALLASLHAVAVELEFVEPVFAGGRLFDFGGELWL